MSTLSESQEAKNLATYLDALVAYKQITCYTKTYQEAFAINGKGWGNIQKRKAEGVRHGLPDYIICTHKALIFVELKKQKGKRGGMNGSVIGEEQLLWIETLNKLGVPAIIAHGADEAIDFIKKYI